MRRSRHSNSSWKQALVFSSYGAIVEWLEKEHGQKIEYRTVYGWVRYRLGVKLKVPRPTSYKQVEEVLTFINSLQLSVNSKLITTFKESFIDRI
jgi:hypothetical protein